MRVIDRKDFLALPPGTVYAKFGGVPTEENALILGDLCIKADHRGTSDWYVTTIPAWPDYDDFDGLVAAYERLLAGEDLPPDFESSTDDGCFDEQQLFAVFSEADIDALIARLETAKREVRDSDTRPKAGDAKPGSTRE